MSETNEAIIILQKTSLSNFCQKAPFHLACLDLMVDQNGMNVFFTLECSLEMNTVQEVVRCKSVAVDIVSLKNQP